MTVSRRWLDLCAFSKRLLLATRKQNRNKVYLTLAVMLGSPKKKRSWRLVPRRWVLPWALGSERPCSTHPKWEAFFEAGGSMWKKGEDCRNQGWWLTLRKQSPPRHARTGALWAHRNFGGSVDKACPGSSQGNARLNWGGMRHPFNKSPSFRKWQALVTHRACNGPDRTVLSPSLPVPTPGLQSTDRYLKWLQGLKR